MDLRNILELLLPGLGYKGEGEEKWGWLEGSGCPSRW